MADLPKPPSFRFDGRKALVVGASSGIGLACAVALAEAGAQVTLCARNRKNLEELAGQMSDRSLEVSILDMDVSDVEHTAKLVSEHGPFDILVNSAGIARHSAAEDTTIEDFDAVMKINIRGAYFLTQAVAKGLIAAGKAGSLINISSQMSVVGGGAGPRGLLCIQTCSGRIYQIHGDRLGAPWHSGEYAQPDLHPHTFNRSDPVRPG